MSKKNSHDLALSGTTFISMIYIIHYNIFNQSKIITDELLIFTTLFFIHSFSFYVLLLFQRMQSGRYIVTVVPHICVRVH